VPSHQRHRCRREKLNAPAAPEVVVVDDAATPEVVVVEETATPNRPNLR
jgi:hypothetical protein